MPPQTTGRTEHHAGQPITAPLLRFATLTRRLAWPLAVVLLTPLIVVAGLAALVGTVALGASGHLRERGERPADVKLAPVLRLETPAAAEIISRAA